MKCLLLGIALLGSALSGPHLAEAQPLREPLQGQCNIDEVLGTAMDPVPDPSCNPMLRADVEKNSQGWRPFRDDVCDWFWRYTLARIERYREYLKYGFTAKWGRRGPYQATGEEQRTEIRFLVIGPPWYNPGVIRNSNYYALGADGTPQQLGIAISSDLDPYAAASVDATKPLPMPPSMQAVYQAIQRKPDDPKDLLHGVLFISDYTWSPESNELAQSPTFSVFVRCYDYVRDYVQRNHLEYDVKPILPNGSNLDYDLLPR